MDYSPLDQLGRVTARVMVVFALAAMVAPIVMTVSLSFGETFIFPPTSLTLRWYADLLSRPALSAALQVSLLLALSTVAVAMIVGTGLALTLTRRRFRGRAALTFLFLSPLVVPKVAIGVALFLYLLTIGVRDAPTRLVIVHALMACPYVIAVTASSLQRVDVSLEQAAMNLGASPWETFRRVTLPLIRPGVVIGAIFAFIHSFDETTASIFLIDARTQTFPVVLFSFLARGEVSPLVAAGSSVMLLVVMAIIATVAWFVGLERVLGISRQR